MSSGTCRSLPYCFRLNSHHFSCCEDTRMSCFSYRHVNSPHIETLRINPTTLSPLFGVLFCMCHPTLRDICLPVSIYVVFSAAAAFQSFLLSARRLYMFTARAFIFLSPPSMALLLTLPLLSGLLSSTNIFNGFLFGTPISLLPVFIFHFICCACHPLCPPGLCFCTSSLQYFVFVHCSTLEYFFHCLVSLVRRRCILVHSKWNKRTFSKVKQRHVSVRPQRIHQRLSFTCVSPAEVFLYLSRSLLHMSSPRRTSASRSRQRVITCTFRHDLQLIAAG